MDKVTAIILAAGKGHRMQSEIPKQFMSLNGRPVLYYALAAYEQSDVDEIVLVTGEEDISFCRQELVERYRLKKVSKIVAGGTERFWSVKNGLVAAEGATYVLIHDGARPCVTPEIIGRSIATVKQVGACTVAVPVKDTIKVVDAEQYGIDTPDRSTLWQVQTPQSFCYSELCEAYARMEQSGDLDITDDTMLMERYYNKKTKVIPGDYHNLKITTPEDLEVAELFLRKNKKTC